MDLKIIVNNTELDLSNNKFEINLTSFNPLTLEDATRKYTSSIKLERSTNNDSVFFAYRYPAFASRETLSADVYVGGILVESFRCVVVVEDDGYSINLTPIKQSLSSDKEDMILSNDKSMQFYLNEGRVIDLYELAKYNYPSLIRRFDISFPVPMITTEITQIPNSFTNAQIIADKVVWSATAGNYVNIPPYIRFENDDLNNHLLRPDEARVMSVISNNSKVWLDDPVQGSLPPTVTLEFGNDLNSRVNLIYESSTSYSRIYRVPNFSVAYNPNKPVRMKIYSDTNKQSFNLSQFMPSISLSGSSFVISRINSGLKNKFDSLKAYAQTFLSYASMEASKVILQPVISSVFIDWSDRFVKLNSISEAGGSARSKRVSYGNVSFELFSNLIATKQYDDIQYSIPISSERNKPSTVTRKGDTRYFYYENYFDSQEYKDKVIALYSSFSECIEYDIEANLSIMDIIDFDQSNPVYIDQLHTKCYILSISGWSSLDGSCKVKLLKLK